jgi:eukaryotic-like serine/threonine-protein kinase
MRLEAGQVIDGRYRLISRLGSGGMAEVWLAEDTMLARRVALKFLLERFTQDAQFVERFRREASSAAGLQHPNVVGVFDRGEHEGLHYIAMEYVEGASLKEMITRGLSVGEAVEIIRQVLAGARFAHAQGIVHRDLKPQNVLIDGEGRARVADFGIARAGASEITQTGSVLGTAQYLSPEQAQGLPVTPASDLYSVGVMLYEALTGQVPFEGDSAVTVAMKQVSERPRPPSELNPEVPRALDAVVLRALAKDPANRFASADEFLHALDMAEADPSGGSLGDTAAFAAIAAGAGAAADPAAAEAGPPGEPPQGRRFWTRGRIIALAVLLLLLAGAAAYALTRPESVLVPSVLRMDAGKAREILEQRGFEVDETTTPNCAPQDTVTEQDPPAGSKADKGSTVTLTVSQGKSVRIPSVAGMSLSQARSRLQDQQLRIRDVQQQSSKRPQGTVLGTEPGQGTEVQCGAPVTLLVSRGQAVITMPDVVGEQDSVARSQLERLGLIVNADPRDADEPEGTVIEQDPPVGTELKKNDTVTIVVSTGAGSVKVPDVIGQSKEAAAAKLKSLGLKVFTQKQETTDLSDDGRVLDQAPAANARVHAGDQVTIVVGKLVKPPPTTTTPTTTTDTIP